MLILVLVESLIMIVLGLWSYGRRSSHWLRPLCTVVVSIIPVVCRLVVPMLLDDALVVLLSSLMELVPDIGPVVLSPHLVDLTLPLNSLLRVVPVEFFLVLLVRPAFIWLSIRTIYHFLPLTK